MSDIGEIGDFVMTYRTIATKLNPSALAVKNDPINPVERQRAVDQKCRHWHETAEICGNDPTRDLARDSAEYIAVLASQLQRIAETSGHEFLAYLIDMVVVEAWRIAGPEADHPNKTANCAGGDGI